MALAPACRFKLVNFHCRTTVHSHMPTWPGPLRSSASLHGKAGTAKLSYHTTCMHNAQPRPRWSRCPLLASQRPLLGSSHSHPVPARIQCLLACPHSLQVTSLSHSLASLPTGQQKLAATQLSLTTSSPPPRQKQSKVVPRRTQCIMGVGTTRQTHPDDPQALSTTTIDTPDTPPRCSLPLSTKWY